MQARADSLVLQERKEAELSNSTTSSSSSLAAPEVRRRGRRLRAGLEDPGPGLSLTPDSDNSGRSSGYQSQGNTEVF